jgi:hypothetical protein
MIYVSRSQAFSVHGALSASANFTASLGQKEQLNTSELSNYLLITIYVPTT